MFLIITIFVLAVATCISDESIQPLLMELLGEQLTTIPIPYNYL